MTGAGASKSASRGVIESKRRHSKRSVPESSLGYLTPKGLVVQLTKRSVRHVLECIWPSRLADCATVPHRAHEARTLSGSASPIKTGQVAMTYKDSDSKSDAVTETLIRARGSPWEVLRFVVAGLANSIITIAIYQIFVSYLSPAAAYAGAWVFGILLVAIVYPRAVYRRRASPASRGTIALVYIGSFFLGLSVAQLLTQLGFHPRLMVFAVLIVTSVINYFGGRIALREPVTPRIRKLLRKLHSGLTRFGQGGTS